MRGIDRARWLIDRVGGTERLRVGPLREGAFTSPLRTERTAAILGIALGVAFGICFITGLLSHLIQHPPSWFRWPARPAGLYRVTQGAHVITGIAAIPLLLAKLWTVYSKLWTWPPVRSVAHAVERISLVPLVGGAVFQLATGFFNALQWYPWDFYFPAAHYQGAWIAIGALVVHAGAKTAVVRSSLRRAEPDPSPPDALSRRGFLGAAFGTAGLLVLVTAGQTVRPLRRFGLLATQKPDVGPQGFPVNKTAREVRVLDLALDPSYRLVVRGRVRRRLALSLDDLRAMPQREAVLPIACVEGWSADARWRGVRVRDVLERAGADEGAEIFVESLQPRGIYRTSILESGLVADPDTLLALEVNGEPLHPDHGYPCRLIAPNRPGVMQTKWVGRLIVG